MALSWSYFACIILNRLVWKISQGTAFPLFCPLHNILPPFSSPLQYRRNWYLGPGERIWKFFGIRSAYTPIHPSLRLRFFFLGFSPPFSPQPAARVCEEPAEKAGDSDVRGRKHRVVSELMIEPLAALASHLRPSGAAPVACFCLFFPLSSGCMGGRVPLTGVSWVAELGRSHGNGGYEQASLVGFGWRFVIRRAIGRTDAWPKQSVGQRRVPWWRALTGCCRRGTDCEPWAAWRDRGSIDLGSHTFIRAGAGEGRVAAAVKELGEVDGSGLGDVAFRGVLAQETNSLVTERYEQIPGYYVPNSSFLSSPYSWNNYFTTTMLDSADLSA